MSQTLLDATWRVETMVGRRQELDQINKAIYGNPEDKRCRVVLVTGQGGIGKSRLLEEVQWRAGHPNVREELQDRAALIPADRENWTSLGKATVSDTIDLLDIRLTARGQMVQSMRRALARVGGVDFQDYELAERAYLEKLRASTSFSEIKRHADIAETAFWKDFRAHTEDQRIVLLLDTAERLVLRSSDWAIERKLLRPEEMVLSSQQWVLDQLRNERFTNTTLIIAGRAEEGGPFFREVQTVLQETTVLLDEIELRPLNGGETALYFQYLAKEWQERVRTANGSRINGDYSRISRSMEALAEDQEQLKVLHLVTGGRPVLLSLYGDLIHETDDMPELLRRSSEKIEQEIKERGDEEFEKKSQKSPDLHQLTPEKRAQEVRELGEQALQSEIERAFINVLFQRPGLRSDIMQTLARCPAGLSAEQLHFLLDSPEKSDVSTWNPYPPRVAEIQRHLEQIRRLSIARSRPDGRLGLQDEIYRIYAQRMADNESFYKYEAEQRQTQYAKLSLWSAQRLEEGRAQLRVHLEEDEKRVASAIRLPTQALRPYIPPPTLAAQEDRAIAQQQIWDWELEKLHYELLRDPSAGLNESYTDLTERRLYDNNEEAEFIIQQEMWRVLYDDNALRFSPFKEEEISRFKTAAVEEDPARWIKRFILRRQYDRAVQFCNAVEQAISMLPSEQRASWLRPINASERSIWRGYAMIMQGQEVPKAVEEIEKTLRALEESNDFGAKARIRKDRVIGAGYNFAGYGYAASLGQFRQAVETYGKALWFTRRTQSPAQEAGIRNNLARALASLGREERGYRVCADALQIRRALGAEIPVAGSLNTLALINNIMQRIPTAWREAAQAAAIFRRSGDDRGLGLALIQLAIGLRRLANSRETAAAMLEATPSELYDTAQAALSEAIAIFRDNPEKLRWIEATLEMGCVLRDQMRHMDLAQVTHGDRQRLLDRLYRDSQIELDRAMRGADKGRFQYLALQACVDLAWTHYYAGRYNDAENAAHDAEDRIPPEYTLKEGKPGPQANETHHFYQLAKLQGLYAGIAMKRFYTSRDNPSDDIVDKEKLYEALPYNKKAKEFMDEAAEGYVKALYYGQLFSPRSRSLVITFDQIYDHVKGFKPVEYSMFYQAQRKAAKNLRGKQAKPSGVAGVQPFDFSNLEDWLIDCFGPLQEKGGEQHD
jgi:hypothetical protein